MPLYLTQERLEALSWSQIAWLYMHQMKCSMVSTINGAEGLVPKGELTPKHMSRVLIFTQDQVQLYWTSSITSTWKHSAKSSVKWEIFYRNRAPNGGLLMPDYLPRNRKHSWWGGESIASQKISYKDPELQAWVSKHRVNRNTLGLQREEKRPGWERRSGKRQRSKSAGEKKEKTSPATCRYPGVMGLFPGPPEKGGLELSPNQKSDQTRTRIRVLCQEEVISLQSSAQAEAQIPASRTGRQEK